MLKSADERCKRDIVAFHARRARICSPLRDSFALLILAWGSSRDKKWRVGFCDSQLPVIFLASQMQSIVRSPSARLFGMVGVLQGFSQYALGLQKCTFADLCAFWAVVQQSPQVMVRVREIICTFGVWRMGNKDSCRAARPEGQALEPTLSADASI